MLENLFIRPMAKDDPERISAAFAAQGWDKPVGLYLQYLQEQADRLRAVFVAKYNGDFAGYVTLVWESNYPAFQSAHIPEIVDLNVLKIYRRRGIASALLQAAEKLAYTRSPVVGIGVGLTADYGPAQRLYAERGYIPDGSGAWSQGKALQYGDQLQVGDDLELYLTRSLIPNSLNQNSEI